MKKSDRNFYGEAGELTNEKQSKKYLAAKLKELRGPKDTRLFKALQTIGIPGGRRVNAGQCIELPKDYIDKNLEMLSDNVELHYREYGDFLR